MPFYTFKCISCNIETEILQGIDESNPVCTRCKEASCGIHTPEMKRLFKVNAKPSSKDGSWNFGMGKSK